MVAVSGFELQSVTTGSDFQFGLDTQDVAVDAQPTAGLLEPNAALKKENDMEEVNNSDMVKLFEREVELVLTDLYQMDIPDWISAHRGAPELYDSDMQGYGFLDYVMPGLSKLKWFSRKYTDERNYDGQIKDEIEVNARLAKQLLQRKAILQKYICPALKRASNDSFDIAKALIPVLVALSLAGTIVISLNPVFVALLSLMIARMGVSSICGDTAGEDKPKDN